MRNRLVGLLTASLAVVAVVVAFHPPSLPWNRTAHLKLQAAQPFGVLDKNASVELGGVKVGKVTDVQYSGGRALVLFDVDEPYAERLHRDAGATVRPHGLLGPKFVDLTAGSQGRLPDGGTIPASRVQVSTDVDQVINSLQPDVRQNLQTFFVEMGKASDGRGEDMNTAFQALGESSQDLTTTAATIQRRDEDLAQFFVFSEELNREMQYAPIDSQIKDTNTVLSGLVDVDSAIGGTIDHMAGVMRGLDIVMNGNSGNLGAALGKAPQTLTLLRTAAAAADGFVSGVNPSLPYFMTAVVETKSAFAGADADGHYVRVIQINGACSTGGPGPCGSPQGYTGPRPNGTPNRPQSDASPSASLGDQQLASLLLGG